MALASDILRGYTDTLILRRLAEGDNYGYQINKQISALSGGLTELKEATLYTAFRRMESAGYIRSYWGDEATGARRRYYAITDAGLEKLCQDCEGWRETKKLIDQLLEG
ncbi:MAG: PadR family transcriptional regulator [Aristaeellaceae bacterium]